MSFSPRSFRSLVGAQFFGAFNDNLFKQLILFLAAGFLFPGKDMQGLAFLVFALPFVVFSGIAGDLSERFSKRRIIVLMKVAEIALMLMGALVLQLMSWNLMLLVLFLMGLQSAIFGPSKYGVIPEIVEPGGLLKANGTIAMTTFLAVLLGQALAGPLLDFFGESLWIPGVICAGLAVVGTLFAQSMLPLQPLRPDLKISRNPFGSIFQTIGDLRKQEGLFAVVLLYSLFWFNGGVLNQAIVSLGEPEYLDIGKGDKKLLSYVMVTLALSIMAGSILAPRIAARIKAGRMAMLGAIVMVSGQALLMLVGTMFTRDNGGLYYTHGVMALIGFFGGTFVVPIQSYLQHAPPEGKRGQTFAVNNFMNFIFMALGGAYYMLMRNTLGLGPTTTQVVAGALLAVFLISQRRRVVTIAIQS